MKTGRRRSSFKFKPFSKKQRKVLNWWLSPVKDKQGIIADGAIRSGKTVSMALSFVMWSMTTFNGQNLGLCGKTISSFGRNVLTPLRQMLTSRKYKHEYLRSENLLTIRKGKIENYYYIFGGKDESSQDLIQGITLAGCFFDEAALMPESFVNQATGRCSVDGSKLWFNCNPSSPMHWFKRNWIDDREKKELIYLHFTMDDNLSLSERVKKRYEDMYAGVFYQRYIKGLWAVAEGIIYSMFSEENIYNDDERPIALYSTAYRVISCDYGTANPTVYLDTYDDGDTLWIDREYRWDSRSNEAKATGHPNKTDSEYADEMAVFQGTEPSRYASILVDPSAKSFITELRLRGWVVKEADNEVLDGIRKTASLFKMRKLMIHKSCEGLITELKTYAWDEKANEDKVIKAFDHGADALRYRCNALPSYRFGDM